ncbi:MAG: ribosome silencing factor [Candidatus Aerophobetes bacterium]|nr:ribosome silencing factor [Candidatus Aerophobetes bacterium]
MVPQKLVERVIEIVESKKAKSIVLLKLQGISLMADYFVICSGESSSHMQSIAQELEKRLKENGLKLIGAKDFTNKCWILLDFGIIVIHIFSKEGREFYQLERLWADAQKTVFVEEA